MGLGSFLSGAVEGAKAYETIADMRSKRKLRDVQAKEAEAEFEKNQKNRDLQAGADRLTSIGMEEGRVKYGDDIDAVINHYNTKTIPELQQYWVQNGRIDQAETLGKFMKTKQAENLTASAAQAIKFASMNDLPNLTTAVGNLLTTSSQVTGGGAYKMNGVTEVVDAKGNKTGGLLFKYTGPDGKPGEMSFNNSSELIGFIRNQAMPDKVVEYAYQQEEQAQAARAAAVKDRREFNQKLQEKNFDHKIKRNELILGSNLRRNEATHAGDVEVSVAGRTAEIKDAYGLNNNGSDGNSKVIQAQQAAAYLQQWGYTDEEIRDAVPALLGVQNRSKDPQVQLQETIKMLASSDPNFADLSATEKVARARELIAAMNGGSEPAGAGLGGTKNPFIDNKTGEVVYR